LKTLTVLFIIFLLLGAYLVVLRNDIDLEEKEGKKRFVLKFSQWIWDTVVNTKNVVGYAIGLDWFPDEPKNQSTQIYVIEDKQPLNNKRCIV